MSKSILRCDIGEAIAAWDLGLYDEMKKLIDDIEKLFIEHLKERIDAVDLERKTAVNKLGYMTFAMYAIAEYRKGPMPSTDLARVIEMADRAVQKHGDEEFRQQQQHIQEAAKEARAHLTDEDGWTCMVPPCVIELIEAVEAVSCVHI